MKFCQYCGAENSDESLFCQRCGNKIGAPDTANMPPVQEQAPMDNQYLVQEQYPMQEQFPVYEQFPVQQQYQMQEQTQNNCYPPAEKPAKKKKMTALIAVLAVVAVAAIAFAALVLTHTICLSHDFSDATCEVPQICQYCEKEGDPALGHAWQEATCTESKKCTQCGKTEGEALGHTWQEATCTQAAVCLVCNTVSSEPPSHTEGTWKETKEATLVSAGEEELSCTKCREIIDTRETSKKDAAVNGEAFNFGHEEFVVWMEEVTTVSLVTDEYDVDDDIITYYVKTKEGEKGLAMFECDAKGNVCAIAFYFEGGEMTSAVALAIVLAAEIDPAFSTDDAADELEYYSDEYTDAGMTVTYTESNGSYIAGLFPSAYWLSST